MYKIIFWVNFDVLNFFYIMIIAGTKLKIADNSGGKVAKCIKVIGLGLKKVGYIGNLILVTVKKLFSTRKIKKKLIYYGLIIMVRQHIFRKDGSIVKFDANRVLLFSINGIKTKFLGSRVYGSLMKEVKFQIYKSKKEKQKYFKIISYSKSII
jgi:large subunit ribosomal protein L14